MCKWLDHILEIKENKHLKKVQQKGYNNTLKKINPLRQNEKLQRIANPSTPNSVARVQISHSPLDKS